MTSKLQTAKGSPQTKAERRTQRLSEDEKIAALQAKIAAIEERRQRQEARSSPLHKDFERFKKHASKFVQSCMDNGRNDIANSVLGVINVTERQIEQI